MTARLLFAAALVCGTMPASSLPEQSIALLLDRSFPEPNLSYILLESPSGRLIASRWKAAEEAVPVGSLVKPFTAVAYAKTHGFVFPQYTCRGAPDHCWLPTGHGPIGLTEAIAYSCNAYFLSLAADVSPDALASVAQEFGVRPPNPGAGPAAFIGIGEQWAASPISIARAYMELFARSGATEVREILKGMSLSARRGTGSAVGSGALVKTGTAFCMHSPRHAADGFTIAMFPSDSPRFTLLVRVDGVTGAGAAGTAGRIRRVLDAGYR